MRVRVHGILLAAGQAKRMGKPKLLEIVNGVPILISVARAAVRSQLADVVIVLGSEHRRHQAAIQRDPIARRAETIVNPTPQQGMSSSLRTGLSTVSETAAGAMIVLCDQPGLSSQIVDRLLERFVQDTERIVVPTIDGRRTTPVLFPAALFQELMHVRGDIGGREVLQRHSELIVDVELGHCYDDRDIDTPQDLSKLRELSHTHGQQE